MKVGIVGLGKMGANMTLRLLRGGQSVVGTDLDSEARRRIEEEGATAAESLAGVVAKLDAPRTLFLMLPAGGVTESVFEQALEALEPGDVMVDGANSFWKDSIRRAERAAGAGLEFVDCGVSGGVWGLESGYNLMVGGSDEAVATIRPALEALGGPEGYLHTGPSGSGHFVKMIHNGIEYAVMQAYGEGFQALEAFPHAHLELPAIARLWQHGSVIRSWLLELGVMALEKDPRLEEIRGYVEDSGMGRWTVDYGVEQAIPLPAITAALFARFRSRIEDGFSDRLSAALRKEFGGHAVVAKADGSEE